MKTKTMKMVGKTHDGPLDPLPPTDGQALVWLWLRNAKQSPADQGCIAGKDAVLGPFSVVSFTYKGQVRCWAPAEDVLWLEMVEDCVRYTDLYYADVDVVSRHPRIKELRAWTDEDNGRAMRQGWGVFNTDTRPEIQRDDQRGKFNNDEAATYHVMQRAAKGEPLAVRAVTLLARACAQRVEGA